MGARSTKRARPLRKAVAEQQLRMWPNPERKKREACKIAGNVLGWRADSGRQKKEAAGGGEDDSCSFARGGDSGPGGFFAGYGWSSGPGGSPRCSREGRRH